MKSLNWLGVIAAALFLWTMRFGLRRMVVPSGAPRGLSRIANPFVRESVGFLVCLIIVTSLAILQSRFGHDLSDAVGIGFLASVVPASVLFGMGVESPHKHFTARAAAVFVGVIASSLIIHGLFLRH